MKVKIFTTYDSKAEAYLQPFFMRSRGEALRGWETICNDPNSQFHKHPSDFTLFEIGEYDEQTGTIETYPAKCALGLALEFVKTTPLAKPELLVNNQ